MLRMRCAPQTSPAGGMKGGFPYPDQAGTAQKEIDFRRSIMVGAT